MDVQSAYDRWSTTYDQDKNATRDLDQLITRRFAQDRHFNQTLELGCGTGKNTKIFTKKSQFVTALDFSRGMIETATSVVKAANIRFIRADINQGIPLKDNVFDLISANLVLEHIKDLDPVFKETFRCLMKKGLFFVSELHPFKQYKGTVANFSREGTKEMIPAYRHHITDFTRTAEAAGFTMRSINEWWAGKDDHLNIPRIISFVFEK